MSESSNESGISSDINNLNKTFIIEDEASDKTFIIINEKDEAVDLNKTFKVIEEANDKTYIIINEENSSVEMNKTFIIEDDA